MIRRSEEPEAYAAEIASGPVPYVGEVPEAEEPAVPEAVEPPEAPEAPEEAKGDVHF